MSHMPCFAGGIDIGLTEVFMMFPANYAVLYIILEEKTGTFCLSDQFIIALP
jgi:hypothetical protein